MNNKAELNLITAFVGLVLCIMILEAIILPPTDLAIMTAVAASVAFVITSGTLALATIQKQPRGGAAARNFFKRSSRGVVVVVTNPEDLRETLYQLRLGGWQPMVSTGAVAA